jgi:hypothetical protein
MAMLLNLERFSVLIGQFVQNQGLIFLSGILAMLGGLAVVRVHNHWSGGWPVIVTILGWMGIVGGVARMWLPHIAAPIAETIAGNQWHYRRRRARFGFRLFLSLQRICCR